MKSSALFIPTGGVLTLPPDFQYDPECKRLKFEGDNTPEKLIAKGWNLNRFTPGRFQLYQMQREATANEILVAAHGLTVAFRPGTPLAVAQLLHQMGGTTFSHWLPLIAFPSMVIDELPLRRMLFMSQHNDLILQGFGDGHPVSITYQAGNKFLACVERFNGHS